MKHKKKLFCLSFFVILFTVSCARTVIPEEVLQIPEFSPVYTSCNLWYDAKGIIRSENIQQGSILPFGTEVEFRKGCSKGVMFRRVSDGKIFHLRYNKAINLLPIEEYIKRIFVLRDAKELALAVRPIIKEKIKRGIVEKGMSRKEVLLAYGPPAAVRTPSETVDTWIYWTDEGVTRRVVFFNNRVTDIIQLD